MTTALLSVVEDLKLNKAFSLDAKLVNAPDYRMSHQMHLKDCFTGSQIREF